MADGLPNTDYPEAKDTEPASNTFGKSSIFAMILVWKSYQFTDGQARIGVGLRVKSIN